MKINKPLLTKLNLFTKELKGYNNPVKDYYVHKVYSIDFQYKLKSVGYNIVDLKQKLIFTVSDLSEDAKINEVVYDESYIDEYINSIYQCDRLASLLIEPMGEGYTFYIESDELYLTFEPGKKFKFQSKEEYYRDLKLKELGI